MASLTVGQSYKSLAFDFGSDGKQWNVNLVNLVNLNDPEIAMTSPLKLYKDRLCSDLDGGAELPWGDTTFTVYISPISSILVERGSSDTEWMSKEVDIF